MICTAIEYLEGTGGPVAARVGYGLRDAPGPPYVTHIAVTTDLVTVTLSDRTSFTVPYWRVTTVTLTREQYDVTDLDRRISARFYS